MGFYFLYDFWVSNFEIWPLLGPNYRMTYLVSCNIYFDREFHGEVESAKYFKLRMLDTPTRTILRMIIITLFHIKIQLWIRQIIRWCARLLCLRHIFVFLLLTHIIEKRIFLKNPSKNIYFRIYFFEILFFHFKILKFIFSNFWISIFKFEFSNSNCCLNILPTDNAWISVHACVCS